MRAGEKVCRSGWNGKGMWLGIAAPSPRTNEPPGIWQDWEGYKTFRTDDAVDLPFIYMRTVTGQVVPWLASQTDMLAEDWEIAEIA